MKRHTPLQVTIVALAAFLAACAGEKRPSGWTAAVDTLEGGVVHVVNTPPGSGIEPTRVIEEELRIGSMDEAGPSSFGQIKGIAVTHDGRIAVLDALAQELRIFGPDGSHLRTFGGKGSGPGEMEGAYGLMLGPEGRLFVPDHRNARMSVFDPDEGLVASHPLRVLTRAFIWRGAMTGDGRILKPSMTLQPGRRSLFRIYDLDVQLLDTLFLPEGPPTDPDDLPSHFQWETPDGRVRGALGVPFYPGRHVLLSREGAIWSTTWGTPEYRITRWTPAGDTTRIVETRRAPIAVTEAERDSAIAATRDYLVERGAASARKDWSKIPEVKPPILSLFDDDDGRLWVEIPSDDATRTYDIYSGDGRWEETAVTELEVWGPLDPVIRGDRFWAVVTDELDVPYVVRARIRSAGGDVEE